MAQEVRSRSSGRRVFWTQVWSGLALVGLATLHMVANHFVVPNGLRTYEDVVSYIGTPAVFVLETAFLVTVTAHALLGVRAVLLDLSPSRERAKQLDGALIVLGVIMVSYATWLMARVAW